MNHGVNPDFALISPQRLKLAGNWSGRNGRGIRKRHANETNRFSPIKSIATKWSRLSAIGRFSCGVVRRTADESGVIRATQLEQRDR